MNALQSRLILVNLSLVFGLLSAVVDTVAAKEKFDYKNIPVTPSTMPPLPEEPEPTLKQTTKARTAPVKSPSATAATEFNKTKSNVKNN